MTATTNAVSVACPAKVNLFLRILAREDSGYHQIETLFQAVGLFDRVDARVGPPGISLSVRRAAPAPGAGDVIGDLGSPESNTVVTAARAFFAATGIESAVSLTLTKRIPAGTGLGGGSSDAAGALIALNALHGSPLGRQALVGVGGRIGADVPFFCAGHAAAVAWGRGDRLLARPSAPAAHAVLAIPRDRVSTEGAYREASAGLALPARPALLQGLETSDWRRLGAFQSNDFERVVFHRHPRLSEVRDILDDEGALIARLTGSGSAVFGIFVGEADARSAARRVREDDAVAAALIAPTLTAMPGPVERAEPGDAPAAP